MFNEISKGSLTITKGINRNSLYILLGKTYNDSLNAFVNDSMDNTILWHQRLGHMSEKCIYYLNKMNVFSKGKINKLDFYENCVLEKQHRLSFNTSINKAKFVLDYVHVSTSINKAKLSPGS